MTGPTGGRPGGPQGDAAADGPAFLGDPQLADDPRFAEVVAITEQLRRSAAVDEAADREAFARIAGAARRGELGGDWRRLQQRIDRGDATLAGAFSGTDDSSEAQSLRTAAAARLSAVSESRADDPAVDDALAELEALQDQLAARTAALRALLEGDGR